MYGGRIAVKGRVGTPVVLQCAYCSFWARCVFLFPVPPPSRSPSDHCRHTKSEEVYGAARNHVMWQVASVGALVCHALEKLGWFILALDAVAPLG